MLSNATIFSSNSNLIEVLDLAPLHTDGLRLQDTKLNKRHLIVYGGSARLEVQFERFCVVCLLPRNKSVEMKLYAQRVNDSLSVVGSVKQMNESRAGDVNGSFRGMIHVLLFGVERAC